MLRKGLLVIIVACSVADEVETDILFRDTSVQLLARYVYQSLPLNCDGKYIFLVKEPLLCEGYPVELVEDTTVITKKSLKVLF